MVGFNTLSIIIVEDSDEDFDTVQEAVKRAGVAVEVLRALSGEECWALLKQASGVRPAMVLMDLTTPGMDGREALQLIKGDTSLKSFPVVVLSTSNNPRDLEFCYAAGANAYHIKPMRYPDHLQIVIDLLRYWLGRVALTNRGGLS